MPLSPGLPSTSAILPSMGRLAPGYWVISATTLSPWFAPLVWEKGMSTSSATLLSSGTT